MGYCNHCGHEHDDPMEVTQAVLDIQPLIKLVYKHNSAGGNLHCIIDDGNYESISGEWQDYLGGTSKAQERAEKKCLAALQKLSLEEREAALSLYHGNIDESGWPK